VAIDYRLSTGRSFPPCLHAEQVADVAEPGAVTQEAGGQERAPIRHLGGAVAGHEIQVGRLLLGASTPRDLRQSAVLRASGKSPGCDPQDPICPASIGCRHVQGVVGAKHGSTEPAEGPVHLCRNHLT